MIPLDDARMRIVDVDELSNYIRDLFDSDPLLDDIWVRGEISNARRSPTGHQFFVLKSESTQLRCVLFKGNAMLVTHQPRDGEAVLCHGRVSTYPAYGQYQLYVDQVLPEGAGLLQLQFEELLRKLESEGIFDESRKRTLPPYPGVIGVVTSATGSVWQDIQHVLRRRYPIGELILSPALVQGEAAPASIMTAIQRLVDDGRAEVMIIGRGGGSIEDLWAFNDERVVRAVFRCPIPVVSAIGHEMDTTLTDLAADVRAATPSAAAEIVAPHIREYQQHLASTRATLVGLTSKRISEERYHLRALHQRLSRFDPHWNLQQERLRVDRLADNLSRGIVQYFGQERARIAGLSRQLGLLDARALLGRGFALVVDEASGQNVRGVGALHAGQQIRLHLRDGTARASVESVEPTEGERQER
jgi:exodeoxyribonuclease VII large subunit